MSIDVSSLLAGPRGRRLCAELLSMMSEEARVGMFSAGRDLSGTTAARVCDAFLNVDIKAIVDVMDELELIRALAETVANARYWQDPDEDDVVLSRPEVRSALTSTAEALLSAPAAQWWNSSLAPEAQHVVGWYDEQGLREDPAPETPILGNAAERLQRWKSRTVAAERSSLSLPKNPAAHYSGHWWSAPSVVDLVSSTRSVPGLGAVQLPLTEDRFNWDRARLWPITPCSEARIYEITGPEAWAGLVEAYPLEVSLSRRHDWYRTTGRAGAWHIPDWQAVAGDYDGVHLTVLGYLTTAGRSIGVDAGVDGSASVLAGWNPDETYWLTNAVEFAGPAQEWQVRGDDWEPA